VTSSPTISGSPVARRPVPSRTGNGGPTAGSTLAMPAMGAIASICSATAISGVVTGLGWLSYSIVSVVACVTAGTALRALRVPAALIWLGQLFVLLCLTVTLFTSSGFLVVLPGPSALHDLGAVFGQAGTDIQNGVPPVAADQPILCLIVLAIGGVAIAVDTLAVTARVPAAAGLILLCVYAVPASLDDVLLPWWSFVLGAAAFTVLLAVDGVQRHQAWRGKLGLPTVATTGVAPATVAVTAVAIVLALFIGGTFTLIGTVGRLPGADGNGDGGTGQLGIEPFTKLQGMLGNQGTSELFDVTGLPTNSPPYLQALTLPDYQSGKGWVANTQMPAGVAADNGRLPYAPGEPAGDPTTKITIQSVNWKDVWLPVFGLPNRLQGIAPDYRYDKESGIVYSVQSRRPGGYTETADLTVPTQAELEAAGDDYSQVDPKYLRISGVNQQVYTLAQHITEGDVTPFEKAQSLFSYFHNANNGFIYSTQTGKPVTGDPLVDFLFYDKTGFCEQYASAMGVMLRTLDIPTRIAIGFTDGFGSGGHQTITSQDAHAWVQAYFPGYGWVNFDPTPLGDGRQQVPGYLSNAANKGAASSAGRQNPDRQNPSTSPTPAAKSPAQAHQNVAGSAGTGGPSGPPSWQLWLVLSLVLATGAATVMTVRAGPPVRRRWLAGALTGWGLVVFFAAALLSWWLSVLLLVLGVAAAPAAVREIRRRRHHRAVAERGPTAADAAWRELLAESLDRGMAVPPSDTLRVAATRMVREHDLDAEGRDSLRTLVGEVERSWYAAPPPGATRPTSSVVVESFDRVRRSLHRNAPLALRARLLPKSVLRPGKPRKPDPDDED